MTETTLNPTKDTYGKKSTATSNFGSASNFWVGDRSDQGGDTRQRTLIQFDLSSIPSGSTINSATLRLYAIFDASANTRTYRIFRVKQAWVEGNATWNKYDASNDWSTAMCGDSTDRETTDIGTRSFTASETLNVYKEWTLTASKIEEMISGGSFTNEGFLIQCDTESSDSYRFNSTDAASNKPELVIDYTPLVATAQVMAWG